MTKDELIVNIELAEKFNKVNLSGVKETLNHIDKSTDIKKLYAALNGSSKKTKVNGKKVLKKYDGIETIITKNVKDADSREALLEAVKRYFFEKYYEAINGISIKEKYIEESVAERDAMMAKVDKIIKDLIK